MNTHPHVKLTSVRIDLSPDPNFMRSKLRRRIERIGGQASEARTVDSTRFVHLPLQHRDSIELFAELLKLPGRDRKTTLVFEAQADLIHRTGHERRIDRSFVAYAAQGSDPEPVLDKALAYFVKQAEELVSSPNHGWSGDEDIEAWNRAHKLQQARDKVVNLRNALQTAEQELREMEARWTFPTSAFEQEKKS